jgi:hypothetical protein
MRGGINNPDRLGLAQFAKSSQDVRHNPSFRSFRHSAKIPDKLPRLSPITLGSPQVTSRAKEPAVRRHFALIVMSWSLTTALTGCCLWQPERDRAHELVARKAEWAKAGPKARSKTWSVVDATSTAEPPKAPLPKPPSELGSVTDHSSPRIPILPVYRQEDAKTEAHLFDVPETAPPPMPTPTPTPAPAPMTLPPSIPLANEKPPAPVAPAVTDGTRSITGDVEVWRKTFRLRYAPVYVADPHGGSITLIGDQLDKLQDGQRVRVQGHVLPGDDHVAGRRFYVQAVQILQ